MRVFIDITTNLIKKSLEDSRRDPHLLDEKCVISQAVKKHFKKYIVETDLNCSRIIDPYTKQVLYRAKLTKILREKQKAFDLNKKVEPNRHLLVFEAAN